MSVPPEMKTQPEAFMATSNFGVQYIPVLTHDQRTEISSAWKPSGRSESIVLRACPASPWNFKFREVTKAWIQQDHEQDSEGASERVTNEQMK